MIPIKFPLIKYNKGMCFNLVYNEIIPHTVFCESPIYVNDYSNFKTIKEYDNKPLILKSNIEFDKKLKECGECDCCKKRKFDEENNKIPSEFFRFRKKELERDISETTCLKSEDY
jgi:hypothetical protein